MFFGFFVKLSVEKITVLLDIEKGKLTIPVRGWERTQRTLTRNIARKWSIPTIKREWATRMVMREMKTVSEKFIKYLQLGCPIKLSVAQL